MTDVLHRNAGAAPRKGKTAVCDKTISSITLAKKTGGKTDPVTGVSIGPNAANVGGANARGFGVLAGKASPTSLNQVMDTGNFGPIVRALFKDSSVKYWELQPEGPPKSRREARFGSWWEVDEPEEGWAEYNG